MASSHNYWITVEPNKQLRADAAASYLRMKAAGMVSSSGWPNNGIQVFRRTWNQQQSVYDYYLKHGSPRAAKPSWGAPHIQGIAMDFYTTGIRGSYKPSPAFTWITAGGVGSSKPKVGEKLRGHAYGWYRTVPSERWHLGYIPSKDTKAAADAMKRVKALGYSTIKEFQGNNALYKDGIAGPATWYKLLTDPKPKADPVPTNRDFRFAQVNFQARRFDGAEDRNAEQAKWVKKYLNVSFLTFQEMDEAARTAFLKEMGASRWKVYPVNYLGVFWDSTKFTHKSRAHILFDTRGIHGALRATLVEKTTGRKIDVISVHVRPRAGFPANYTDVQVKNGKLGDVDKALKLVRAGVPTIFAGDFNTAYARARVLGSGKKLIAISPDVDTVDVSGEQRLDMVFATADFVTRKVTLKDASISDHKMWLWQGTLPASDK